MSLSFEPEPSQFSLMTTMMVVFFLDAQSMPLSTIGSEDADGAGHCQSTQPADALALVLDEAATDEADWEEVLRVVEEEMTVTVPLAVVAFR